MQLEEKGKLKIVAENSRGNAERKPEKQEQVKHRGIKRGKGKTHEKETVGKLRLYRWVRIREAT